MLGEFNVETLREAAGWSSSANLMERVLPEMNMCQRVLTFSSFLRVAQAARTRRRAAEHAQPPVRRYRYSFYAKRAAAPSGVPLQPRASQSQSYRHILTGRQSNFSPEVREGAVRLLL